MNLATEYESGKTLVQLSKKYKLSPSAIRARLLQQGVKMRPTGIRRPNIHEAVAEAVYLRTRGFTYKEIGEKLALSRQRVHQLVAPFHIKPLPRATHTKILQAVELLEALDIDLQYGGRRVLLFDVLNLAYEKAFSHD